jgi:hypothetical protein
MEKKTMVDIYTPTVDKNGNYIDSIPYFSNLPHGISCPCGTRKDKVYISRPKFSSHTESFGHILWLEKLNANKTNYFVECERHLQTIKDQSIILCKQNNDIINKDLTIVYLTKQLNMIEHCKNINDKTIVA